MDLEQLREALGDETLTKLQAYVDDLTGQRDAARKESIDGRKGLKAKVAELEQRQAELFERLGIESVEDLEEMDPKGQAEAAKQFEARTRRLEKELAERQQALEALDHKYRGTRQEAALRQALGQHEWIDADLVASFAGARLTWEDDQLLYQTEDGKVVSLDEGVQTLAKSKPHLLKAPGAGGSGFRGAPASGAGQKNPWAKETRNLTEQARLLREDPNLAASLQQAADAA